jgi:hypothetical protein
MSTPTNGTCPLSQSDGAYVLGALSPAERHEFEQHLAGCKECSRSVRELAGIPGLLSRIDPSVLEDPADTPPVPETLLPSLLAEVRRTRRRRTYVVGGLAAAAVLALVAVPLGVSGVLSDDNAPVAAPPSATASATAPSELAMDPVGGAPVRASLALEPVLWGTRLDLTCTYEPDPDRYSGLPHKATYVLVVRTRDGKSEQVGTWQAIDGRTMRLSAATAARRAQISSVEVQTTDGRPVLRLSA